MKKVSEGSKPACRAHFRRPDWSCLRNLTDFPMIIGIEENSPAEKADLKLGTPVYAMDGRSTLEMSILEINLLLKSKEAIPVEFKLDQGNENEIVNLETGTAP